MVAVEATYYYPSMLLAHQFSIFYCQTSSDTGSYLKVFGIALVLSLKLLTVNTPY